MTDVAKKTDTVTLTVDGVEVSAAKGELVILVAPPLEPETASNDAIDRLLDDALARLSPSRAAAEVAERLGIPRKRAYDRALDRSRK